MKKDDRTFDDLRVTPEQLAHLVAMIAGDEISSRAAKDILMAMVQTGADPHEIVKEKGLHQVSNADDLKTTVEKIIIENPKAVEDYKRGKHASLQFLIGKAMGELKGTANPKVLKEVFEKLLK